MYKSIIRSPPNKHMLLPILTVYVGVLFFLNACLMSSVTIQRFMARVLDFSHRSGFDQKQINTGVPNSTNQGFHSNDSPDSALVPEFSLKTLTHWNLINFINRICIYRQFTVKPILKHCVKKARQSVDYNYRLYGQLCSLPTQLCIMGFNRITKQIVSHKSRHFTFNYISRPIVFPIWYKTSKILVQTTNTHTLTKENFRGEYFVFVVLLCFYKNISLVKETEAHVIIGLLGLFLLLLFLLLLLGCKGKKEVWLVKLKDDKRC